MGQYLWSHRWFLLWSYRVVDYDRKTERQSAQCHRAYHPDLATPVHANVYHLSDRPLEASFSLYKNACG